MKDPGARQRRIMERALVRASLASCFLLLASSCLLLCRAAERGSFQPRVRIRDFAEVQGETIRLSDLLPPDAPSELEEISAQIVLGNSPLPASQRVITKDQIELQLREFPSVRNRLDLPERLIVSCKQRRLSPEEIWQAIETLLAAEGLGAPPDGLRNLLRSQAPVYVTKEDPGLVVQRMEPDPVRRQIRVLLWTSKEPQLLPFYVTLEGLSSRAERLASTHSEGGLPTMPADSQKGSWKTEEGKLEALLNSGSRGVSGRKVGHALPPAPPVILVTKGKPTKLVVQTATLRITAIVTPLESGAQGQIIRVKNLDTQRVFGAEVVGADLLQARLTGE